jgi:hypothetical protein
VESVPADFLPHGEGGAEANYTCAYWVLERGRSCYEMVENYGYDCRCTCLEESYTQPASTPESIDPCRPDPCVHGACVEVVVPGSGGSSNGYQAQCVCEAGWEGADCADSVVDFHFGNDELWEVLEPLLACAADV